MHEMPHVYEHDVPRYQRRALRFHMTYLAAGEQQKCSALWRCRRPGSGRKEPRPTGIVITPTTRSRALSQVRRWGVERGPSFGETGDSADHNGGGPRRARHGGTGRAPGLLPHPRIDAAGLRCTDPRRRAHRDASRLPGSHPVRLDWTTTAGMVLECSLPSLRGHDVFAASASNAWRRGVTGGHLLSKYSPGLAVAVG